MSKLMIRLSYLSVFILLFCGPAVLFSLGWVIDSGDAPFYQKLRPEFYLLFLIFVLSFSHHRNKSIRHGLRILYLSAFTCLYWLLTGQVGGFAVIVNPIIIPALIFIILQGLPEGSLNKIFYIVIAFYIINCALAIWAVVTGYNLFPYYFAGDLSEENELIDLTTFRATALRNHPLGNALLTAIIFSFIIVTDKIKGYYKFLLALLGYIGIMCFNARSSMMIVPALTCLYLLYNVFCNKKSHVNKFYMLIGVVLIALIVPFLFEKGLGGRLLEEDNLNDTSVGARLMLFDWFMSADYSLFLFGMSNDDIGKVIQMAHIENWAILYLLRMGVFIFSGFIFCFYKLLKKCCQGQKKSVALYTILMTFVIASTNNSIYSGDPAIAVFILCAYSMFPQNKQKKHVTLN